ncbi:flocculation protein FLO11-like, partial [Diachasma alloeum]|uniref:flocculation protein FLO11-like n=1 Tax=Diachasma alloeum TaxID=454923 RepID=UPI0007382283
SPPESPQPRRRGPAPRESGVVKTEEPSSAPSSSTKEVSQEEQDFVAALWPNGAPPELADFHFPNTEQEILALSPPRSPYHPETEAISRPNTPNPSGTQPDEAVLKATSETPQGVLPEGILVATSKAQTSQAPNQVTTTPSPTPPNVELGRQRAVQPVVLLERIQVPPPVLRIEEYWEPLEPWLPDVWSVERRKKGFMRALQACSLQPLRQITEHRYIIPPIPVPVGPDGVHPLVLANLIDPVVTDHDPPRSTLAHSPGRQAPAPPSPRSPEAGVTPSDASSSSSSSSSSSTSSSSSPSTSSSSSVASCSEDEAEQAHQTHSPTVSAAAPTPMELEIDLREDERASLADSREDTPSRSPNRARKGSTSSDQKGSSIPLEVLRQLPLPIREMLRGYSPVIPITGPTPSTSGSDQNSSPVIPVTGSSPPTLGSGHNTPPEIPTAGQATSATTQGLPVLDGAAGSRSDSAAVLPESSSNSRRLEPTQGNDPSRSTQKKGPSKKRIWCFDCRRHGHRPADCPNPTGETFCGKCPFRVARNRPCPIHGTDLAGAACSRSASRPAGAEERKILYSRRPDPQNINRGQPATGEYRAYQPPFEDSPRQVPAPYWTPSPLDFPPLNPQYESSPSTTSAPPREYASPRATSPLPRREVTGYSSFYPATSSRASPLPIPTAGVTLPPEAVAAIADIIMGHHYPPRHSPEPTRPPGDHHRSNKSWST